MSCSSSLCVCVPDELGPSIAQTYISTGTSLSQSSTWQTRDRIRGKEDTKLWGLAKCNEKQMRRQCFVLLVKDGCSTRVEYITEVSLVHGRPEFTMRIASRPLRPSWLSARLSSGLRTCLPSLAAWSSLVPCQLRLRPPSFRCCSFPSTWQGSIR